MEECRNDRLLTSFLNGGVENLLESLLQMDLTSSMVSNWGMAHAISIYKHQMSKLTWKENGFHFLTAKLTEEQLQRLDVEDLMKRIIALAPDLWKLMENLHAADSRINYVRTRTQKRSKKMRGEGETSHVSHVRRPDGDIEMGDVWIGYELDDEEEYWKAVETEEITLIEQEDDEPEDLTEQSKTQIEALAQIVSRTALPQPHVINVVSRNKSYASVS
jgi:hypothetical protein